MSSEVNSTKKVGSRTDTTKSKNKYQFPSSNHNEDSKKKTKLTTNAKKEKPRVPVKITSSKDFGNDFTDIENNKNYLNVSEEENYLI